MVFSVDDVDQYSVNDETKLTFEFGSDQQAANQINYQYT